mmetsp:Transcript_17034/g.51065  ORF Transcript_17034/g.51065 Transcript_17034/m.51065 type:complete len:201 (+) Transcript_17034:247-849(+)
MLSDFERSQESLALVQIMPAVDVPRTTLASLNAFNLCHAHVIVRAKVSKEHLDCATRVGVSRAGPASPCVYFQLQGLACFPCDIPLFGLFLSAFIDIIPATRLQHKRCHHVLEQTQRCFRSRVAFIHGDRQRLGNQLCILLIEWPGEYINRGLLYHPYCQVGHDLVATIARVKSVLVHQVCPPEAFSPLEGSQPVRSGAQ